MINTPFLLGVDSSVSGKRNSLTKPSRLDLKSRFSSVQLTYPYILPLSSLLVQTARFLSGSSPDRLRYSNQRSGISWDNWQPIDRLSDRDTFDYKVDRSSQINKIENPELDFFTTVLPTEFVDIDPQLDFLPTYSIDVERPTFKRKDRVIADAIQPQSIEELQPKSVEPDRKLSNINQIDQIEQQQLSERAPKIIANIQPQQILQASPEMMGELAIIPESSLDLSRDNLGSNTVDDSRLKPLPEMSIDLNFDVPISPDLDPTQISRFIVGREAPPESKTTPNLAFPSELIPDPSIPNLLNTPTIINPVINPQVAHLEPEVETIIIPEAAVSPENITPFTVLEQTAAIPESLDRLRADPIASNPIDLPTLIDSQLPEVATTQPPLLATATENIPSVMPLAIEPVHESISDTLQANLSDLPITNQPPSTDPSQVSGTLDELALAHLDVPALPSNLIPTTSPLSADLRQNAIVPDRILPQIQSSQPLNPDTTQLNLAADRSNIDRDSAPSIQLEPANPNIPELSSTLPTDALSPNLLPAPNPEQIVSAVTPQLNSPDLTIFAQTPLALEQTSTFTDEQTPANLESSPIPIIESLNTLSEPDLSLAESHLPRRLDPEPDLTIESIPSSNVNIPDLNLDRSHLENSPLASTEFIEVKQENITEAISKLSSENSLSNPLVDRLVLNESIINSSQNISQIEHPPVDTINDSDDIVSSINNPTQVDLQTTALPTIGQEELSSLISIDSSIDIRDDNSSDITIPAPIVGYATGGYVKDANHIDLQSIATSDTVSAMLTPGEFVINAKDAQKNLDLLTHINRGGEPETALPNLEIKSSTIEPLSTSPDISPTSIQRKSNDSLVAPSLHRDIGLQQLSPLINTELDTFESSQTESSNSSPGYSSLPMVFRKPMSSAQPQYTGTDTPDEWGSVEDLINRSSNNLDPFSFENISPQQPDLESRSSPSMSPRISPQYATPIRGFADGGEVTPSDISTTIEPITKTIESPINNPQQQPENNDPAELEILAREIYHRLRQRLEIERERHGSYSGNLAW